MAQQLPLIEPRTEIVQVARTAPAPKRRASGAKAFAVAPDLAQRLIEIPPVDWHIDEHTKEVGLAGVAAARQALAAAVGRVAHPEERRRAA